uniref:Chromosome segregation ATPase n=1 Tax=Candidatus Kentrum sp. MB TaxID=2138164 RepID=A0A451B9E1_9GAMM|nr:MAG: Chromosome segregation ATPase [Candidatus Kentron sp. MB]VFK27096.1 MAG: Chromosome segregation ATPase [Candidatus Kentron sp. MB]VFK74909.1 MAG: Chromosome segregation ATPase [Candidatus Kentron sp. MB]
MSDSPKRSIATIRAEQQREIEAARRHQAEIECARRTEETARRQRERLQRAKNSLHAQVERSLEVISNTSNSPFADAVSIRQIADEVRQIEQQLRSATDERGATRLQKQLDKIQGRLKKANSASKSATKHQRSLRKEIVSYRQGPETQRGGWQTPFANRLSDIVTSLDQAVSQNELSHIEADWSKLRTDMKWFTAECDALEHSIGRISTKLNDLQKKWNRFAASPSATFVSPDSFTAIDSQLKEFSREIDDISESSKVPSLEQALTKLAGNANETISAGDAIAAQVERIRKTLSGLQSRADALTGNVVRRFVPEEVLDTACQELARISTVLNDTGVGSRLDACAASLAEIEKTLGSLENNSKEARQFAGRVEKQLGGLVRERQRFSKSASAQFAGERIGEVDVEIRSIETDFQAATTIKALRLTLEQISHVAANLSEVMDNAKVAQFEHDIQNQQSVLATLRETMSQVDSPSAEKFDRDGSRRATAGLERAASLLDSRQLQKAVKEIVTVSRLVDQHVQTVAERRAAYETTRNNAQELISNGNRRFNKLVADVSTDQRLANEIRSIEGHLRQAVSNFDREEFDKAEQTANAAMNELDQLMDLIREWSRYDDVDSELASLDRTLCVQHDADGYQSTRQHLSAAANHLRQRKIILADSEITAAHQALIKHQQRLESHLGKWRVDRQKAEMALLSVQNSFEVLVNDNHASSLVEDSLQMLRNKEIRLNERFNQHHFEAVQREAESLIEEIENTSNTAQSLAKIRSEEERLAREIDESQSRRFDVNGYQEIIRLMATLREAIHRRQLSNLDKELDRLGTRIDQHIILVSEKLAEWNEQRAEIGTLIGAAEDQISAMAMDETLMRWARSDIEDLHNRLSGMSRLADEGEFGRVKDGIANCTQTARNILEAVEAVQLKEEQRNYIVRGVQGVLRDMGFDVEDGYPLPENSDDPFSATILRAQQINGRSISVSIPQDQEEEVWYEVEGFDMNVDSHEGQLIRTCDGAEAQLAQLHEQLHELGIEMSELWWDGKPEDEWKTADTLPRTEASPRTQPRGK